MRNAAVANSCTDTVIPYRNCGASESDETSIRHPTEVPIVPDARGSVPVGCATDSWSPRLFITAALPVSSHKLSRITGYEQRWPEQNTLRCRSPRRPNVLMATYASAPELRQGRGDWGFAGVRLVTFPCI